ncbi:hypothetical protein PL11201_710013 [Planktothrix sp. PCC 11201]|nr:hypothetical protein PL11201_710013 [Planktothrix sp. PCC 11201]
MVFSPELIVESIYPPEGITYLEPFVFVIKLSSKNQQICY